MAEGLAAILAVTFIFGWPVIKILTNHHARITQMKLEMRGGGGTAVLNEMRELKQQVNELRDTSTRYDISFDAALQRMESRIARVEQRTIEPEVESLRLGG